jgi:fructosamine-3-kinase
VVRNDRISARAGLVDPACAFADREMEFGITTLGGFSSGFFEATRRPGRRLRMA